MSDRMFGVFHCYSNGQEHLIEKFKTNQEATYAKSKYIVDVDETVLVKTL